MSFDDDTAIDLGEAAGVEPSDKEDVMRDKIRERFEKDTLSDNAVDELADHLDGRLADRESGEWSPPDAGDARFIPGDSGWRDSSGGFTDTPDTGRDDDE